MHPAVCPNSSEHYPPEQILLLSRRTLIVYSQYHVCFILHMVANHTNTHTQCTLHITSYHLHVTRYMHTLIHVRWFILFDGYHMFDCIYRRAFHVTMV